MRRSAVVVALALLASAVAAAVPGRALADPRHEAEMRQIARDLACPVCQGLSVADSPSQLAGQMRETILQKLEAGESRDQIVQFFVDRYGESILFDPPKQGFSLLVWWVPVLVVVAGGVALGLLLAGWLRARPAAAAPAPTADDWATYGPRIEAELARREGRQAS